MGSPQSKLYDEETSREQDAQRRKAGQQRRIEVQQQIEDDRQIARELTYNSDNDQYRLFKDKKIAQRIANGDSFDSARSSMWDLTDNLEYTSALHAEHQVLLCGERGSAGQKRRKTLASHSSEDISEDANDIEGEERNKKRGWNLDCVVCADIKSADQAITLSCEHHMCKTCAIRLFKGAMKDEALFPPRCCRTHEIPVDLARPLIGNTLAVRFEEKAIELCTQDRTYCHVPHCSKFIKPDTIVANVGRCTDCLSTTCALCKGRRHKGEDCPLDEGRRQVEEMARENGWRQCGGCKRMVELNYGCFHMTCLCGHNFCYLCGVEWKNCGCRQWEENRLYQRAEAVVNRRRDPPAPRPRQRNNGNRRGRGHPHPRPHTRPHADPPGPPENVREAADRLRENHECEHEGRWRRFHVGEHRCEICRRVRTNPQVGECPRCFLQACYYCRKHRMR